MRPRRKKILIGASVALGLFSAFTFAVHLRFVQVAMGWTNPDGTGACPFGYDAPRAASARPSGAAAVDVFGIALGSASRSDVLAWAREHKATCTQRRAELECANVTLDSGATTLWFELDRAGAVSAVKISRRSTDLATITTAFADTEQRLTARGPAHASSGSTADLPIGAFHQAMREFRSDGYRAVVRATNMGDGYLLTERHSL